MIDTIYFAGILKSTSVEFKECYLLVKTRSRRSGRINIKLKTQNLKMVQFLFFVLLVDGVVARTEVILSIYLERMKYNKVVVLTFISKTGADNL